jgi:conjugative transfer signal peptidase TraF
MMRRRYAMATAIAASVFAVSFIAVAVVHPQPRLVWNASASAPIGLYRIQPDRDPPMGALVAAMPPDGLARWLAQRGYLPDGLPLLKHIAAKAGQRICRHGAVVSIDTRPVVIARARDGRGRPLPVWHGCHTLQDGELLLLNPAVPDSLDGRYFGPLPASVVIGRALPLHLSAPTAMFSPVSSKETEHAREHL